MYQLFIDRSLTASHILNALLRAKNILMIIACPRCELRYDVTAHKPGSPLHCRCGNTIIVPRTKTTAGSLQCPNCGGSVPAQSHQCPFCSTHLAILSCPKCFNLQFSGGKFCSQCGTELRLPARDTPSTPYDCPRCHIPLSTHHYANTSVDHCKQCGGLWLDHRTFERKLDKARQERPSSVSPPQPGQHSMINNFPVSYLPCPECKQLMHRQNFAKQSGVIIDVCTAHGVWLDHRELPAILQFIHSGGEQAALRRQQQSPTKSKISPLTTQENKAFSWLNWSDLAELLEWLPFSK